MKSRSLTIMGIILAWVIFVVIILAASAYISVFGFAQLEQRSAVEDSNRVFRILISNFDNINLLNQDSAYWDDTYEFVEKQNKSFIEKNYSEDFFKDQKINYLIFVNTAGDIVWSKGYDLVKKVYAEIPQEVLDFFKKNSIHMLRNAEDYNSYVKKGDGLGGFLKTSDGINNIAYFALNDIKDSNDTKPSRGAMIYGRVLTPEFLKRLSDDFNYQISLVPLSTFTDTQENKKILDTISADDSTYTKVSNDDALTTFRVLKDFTSKTIATLRVDLPRTLYNQSRETSFRNRLILMAFSLIALIAMSALVFLFFRKQDVITKAFERFVPHQLIELLKKKDITDVSLGNSSERIITVLFMDIRNFTTISEGLSPQDNFEFLNTILKDIAPIIANNNGFIDKFIGDAIMAIFPKAESNADDAIRAGMMILDELDKINYTVKMKIAEPVKIGIGINSGKSILGIIGASGRLEGTVISDVINTASRIQSLTKKYECPMLISEQTYKALKSPEFFAIIHIEDVQLKGKSEVTSIYKVEKRR